MNACATPDGRITAVVFDLGGVLINWNPRHLYQRLFIDPSEMEEFLATICTDDWHREHDLGADIRESCESLARLHPNYRNMIMAWAERSEDMVAGQFDQTVAVLAELEAARIRCYALSNMEREVFPLRYERFPFMKWFDGHVISGLERVAKPDPQIYEILLGRYGLEPSETVFIDDSLRNVEAARKLRINAVHYTSAQRLRHELIALGITGIASS